MTTFFDALVQHPRRWLLLLALVCVGMFGYGLYLQHVVGLQPCPMCVVQRYALLGVMLLALLTAAFPQRGVHLAGSVAIVLMAGFGAFTAARQSWLQWYPPEFVTCGRDFYGMIASFPLERVIPMLFSGSGDCAKVDWIFLGLTIANWSFLVFTGMALLALALFVALLRRRAR
ncbi:disulfide bond formation protein DsbB [Serpentinimonas maccroryi]|uniref:Disulfide bond formation protein B n=1 Tax=Serpentinimonas maccroryi TaxID=1458426 RepID=A0A060NLJ2_9BURK|nr:disulfide bond formation protein B [Serpentinimonas maccroryi]MBA4252765.1 disulfide bond formation protein B [Comamonadaceae bacterium]OYX59496.1 MAG: disulfide bond formation protein B [Comamonadaceae bacterium 32-67-11]BAO83396.1 disulfide bond formation protein DsbB [Serpentinimonas maccroryi]